MPSLGGMFPITGLGAAAALCKDKTHRGSVSLALSLFPSFISPSLGLHRSPVTTGGSVCNFNLYHPVAFQKDLFVHEDGPSGQEESHAGGSFRDVPNASGWMIRSHPHTEPTRG